MKLPIGVFRVLDRSMEPLLHENDYVVVNRWYGKLKAGDIVVLRHPTLDIRIIKQVSRVGDGKLYVVGINRMHSKDSRVFGEVGRSRVIGKMLFKL